MKDNQRIALGGIVLLVVLRISIGWQFLYEGLWKIDRRNSAQPWTAAGYLKNAQGPLRGMFRAMAGDPDELDWLNYRKVARRWDRWAERFAVHYDLSDYQKRVLKRLMEGAHTTIKVGDKDRNVYAEPVDAVPEGFAESGVQEKVLWYDADKKMLYVDARLHLKPNEREKLDALVGDSTTEAAEAWRKAVRNIYDRQKKGLGYKEKLAGALKGNSELLGYKAWQRLGKREQYERMLARYESDRSRADQKYEWDHLDHSWKEIQALRAELTGPIKAMEKEMKGKAHEMLSIRQHRRGELSEPWTVLRVVDLATMTALALLGLLLILGLKSRAAAVAGALLLLNCYLAMPPWPGVPELPGPEHSFIVNKNLIEVIALLALATMPTGYWFGMDGVIARWQASRKGRKSDSVETGAEAHESGGEPAETAGATATA